MKARMQIDTAALDKALQALPSQMRSSTYKAAVRAGAREIVKVAKAKAPVDSGELRRSIFAQIGRSRPGGARAVVGFKGAVFRRAHLTEFGTARTAPRPFMRPAIAQAFQASISAAAKAMAKHLAKNAAKLAGSGGRKHFARGLRRDARARRFGGGSGRTFGGGR